MKSNTYVKRLVALFMAIAMCMSFSAVAFAIDESEADNQATNLQPISESGMSREEALEILGITEEELGDGELYVAYEPVSLSSTKILNSGDVVEVGQFTFTSSNVGSTLLAFNANKARFGVSWRWLNPEERTTATIKVVLTGGGGASRIVASSQSGFGDGDFNSFYSEWGEVTSQFTYHFEYSAGHGYWVENFPPPTLWVAVVIAAV